MLILALSQMLRIQRRKYTALSKHLHPSEEEDSGNEQLTHSEEKCDQQEKRGTRTGICQGTQWGPNRRKEVCPNTQEEALQAGGKASAKAQKHEQACHVHTDTCYYVSKINGEETLLHLRLLNLFTVYSTSKRCLNTHFNMCMFMNFTYYCSHILCTL